MAAFCTYICFGFTVILLSFWIKIQEKSKLFESEDE